ncbi:MAG: sigma-54-dependent Fis family transcriptional regulator [Deltaproteobacteria bacterium]|nr:sigma-54-dependent Fis family transcriptional regulator [Deltaproteobacteria bacterium]
MSSKRILIIDDEENMLHMLKTILSKEGYEIVTAGNGIEGLEKIETNLFDTILCDLRMPEMDGLSFLKTVKVKNIDSTIIMMSAYGTIDLAVEAMKHGAYDYISKPFKPDEIILNLRKAEERERLRKENILLKKEIKKEFCFENIITKNDKMLQIFETIHKISDYDTSILILGESGTGKELVAKAIHYNSKRSGKPFVAINCGAIPENLLESELFGYVKGAFTDANQNKKGLFEEANGGTLLLDEIGELPSNLQVKLLRTLQEGEVRKVGDTKQIKLDVRIIAATSKNLGQEVRSNSFREDLFYRVNVIQIDLPPLRERREDIPLLINHFLNRYNEKHHLKAKNISSAALNILVEYDWQGNIRELENAIERAVILSEGSRIEVSALPPDIRKLKAPREKEMVNDEYSIKRIHLIMEEQLIKKALDKTKGNRTQAARLLEISHPSLLSKMKEFRLR